MQFESFSDFLHMGGHALYVWLAYGSTCLVLLGSWLSLRVGLRRQLAQLRWQIEVDAQAVSASDDLPTGDAQRRGKSGSV